MYYRSETVAHIASQWRQSQTRSVGERGAGGHCCICSSEQRVDVMAAVLKIWWRHIEIRLRRSVRIYLRMQNNPAKFHPDLKRQSHGLFEKRCTNKNETTTTTTRWVAIWDQFLVQKYVSPSLSLLSSSEFLVWPKWQKLSQGPQRSSEQIRSPDIIDWSL